MKKLVLFAVLSMLLFSCAQNKSSDSSDRAKELADQLRSDAENDKVDDKTADVVPKEKNEKNESAVVETKEEPNETVKAEPIKTSGQVQNGVSEEPSGSEVDANEEIVSAPVQRTATYRFLDVFAKEVSSYKFSFKDGKYFSKGNRFKVILDNPVTIRSAVFPNGSKANIFYYDTVYVDRVSKSAVAYCEGYTDDLNRQCTKLDLRDLGYPVSFEKYNILLPEDWLFSFVDKEPYDVEENKYVIKGRSTVLLSFRGNLTTDLYFDKLTGLIVRAELKKDGHLMKSYSYDDVASNKVRDVDVVHRSLGEIPSEDYFYHPQ